MATRSSISIVSERTENGKGKTIYSHWDGYPSHNGRILLEHYQDAKKVKALIKLGDISSLAENIEPQEKGVTRQWDREKGKYVLIEAAKAHSFDTPHDGVVVAYGRDRGETGVKATTFKGSIPNDNTAQEFDYLFVESEKQWYVRNNHAPRPKFVKLTQKMCKDD
jgi:hypothetical protein